MRSSGARRARGATCTVVGDDVIASTGYMKKQPLFAPARERDVYGSRILIATPTSLSHVRATR